MRNSNANSRLGRGVIALGPIRRLLASERGGATIESVMWLPVFLAFFGMVVDTSMVFSNRSLALRVIQDANRSLALHRLASPTAAEEYVYDRVKSILPTATVVTIDNGTTIATRLSAPASEFDAIGLFGFLTGVQIAVQAQQMKES